MNLKDISHIHFTGLKGVGMTSLALCAQDLGIKVTGSDVSELFVTDEILEKRGLHWNNGFDSKNLDPRPDLLIATGAHGGLTNPEVVYARENGIEVMTHAEALGEFAQGKETIAVCGVGGKTTISSMVASILEFAGEKPSFAVGVGNIFPLGTPGKYSEEGKAFVCEADEFAISPGQNNKPRFSYLNPKILIATNIEHDHPDIYPTFADTKRVFKEFFDRTAKDGTILALADNKNTLELAREVGRNVVTYGFSEDSDWHIKKMEVGNGFTKFDLANGNETHTDLVVNVPGTFNVQNAAAAFTAALLMGVAANDAKAALEKYQGCMRRFEIKKEVNGILYVDDYAHHPNEINETLKAAKTWFPDRRIVALFQPHTYSRTKALFDDFALAFGEADLVGIMDIYSSAREALDATISSKMLAEKIKDNGQDAHYTKGHDQTLAWIKENAKEGDLVITLGAGDIFYLHGNI